MLTILLVVGGIIPLTLAQDFPLSILSADDNVITGRFLDSLLLSLPPCTFAGNSVDLEYLDGNTNKSYTLNSIFTVPDCNNNGDPKGSSALSRNLGYQMINLSSGTQYRINYKIGNNRSIPVIATTRAAVSYTDIGLDFPGRSAAMVVITVLLSVAMFILLICIIVSPSVSPSAEQNITFRDQV